MSVPAEMPAATPATVHTQIESGSTNPIYLLLGKDEVEKLELAHAFDALVDEELRAFNVERIHAGEWTTGDRLAAGVASVVAAVRTLPMMSPRRVVLILQGEGLLVPRRESEAAARALEELERLVKRPEPQTTLVICARSLDKRSRIYKLLAKEATVVECGVLEDRADAERWVKHRVAAAGLDIAPGAVRLLGVLCGPDIKRLRNDLERLLLYTRGCQTITVEDVREIAGPAALQDDWAMTNAIEGGHAGDALRQPRADARCGCAAGKGSRAAGLARSDQVSSAGVGGRAARGGRGAVQNRSEFEALSGRRQGSCSNGSSTSCVRRSEPDSGEPEGRRSGGLGL